DEIVLQLDGQLERLGDAATWILDRSYPAYPTIHFKGFTLQFAPQKDLVCYRKNPIHFAPSLRDGAGLDRILRAIQHFSPWLDDGTSILVIDPPPGGGILRAFERAKRRFNGGGLHVYHLATSENSDTLDDLGADLRYLKRVNKLE